MRESLDGLPDPLVGSILHNLSDTDLLNVRATQRRLKAAADSLSKASPCRTAPRCAPLYLAARARHFAWRHELGPHETLASVALRYDCEAAVLRRCNNLMDDAVEDVAASCLLLPLKKADAGPIGQALNLSSLTPDYLAERDAGWAAVSGSGPATRRQRA
ncbi:hypothetical protein APUTEX25_002757 [Auxenochlorella protothecoides]|uniref:F-box domain-containing protein n=1 Tax=Auxenochlorella protothecoides TaxID=3075 RepID=A0A3M7L1S5_AUXPR|nr:hypothetical protein APUTEX25_002757 [Auxenochlorella protothecoides]|eukprot:RMZ56668.1 hypothetical protein APUTEX25_002757 [Auxenochlorella protothecoides]